jgi:hypothetical protein
MLDQFLLMHAKYNANGEIAVLGSENFFPLFLFCFRNLFCALDDISPAQLATLRTRHQICRG